MTLILDAGAFLAIESGNARVVALLKRERLAQRAVLTHGGVIAQVWRGGTGKQVPVARALAAVDVVPVDSGLGKRAGVLLGRAGTADAVDAALVCLAKDGDLVITSDTGDLEHLATEADLHIELIPV